LNWCIVGASRNVGFKRLNTTLHEDQYTFTTLSGSALLRMRNVSDKSCRENQNTHFVFNNILPPENRAVCETVCKILQSRTGHGQYNRRMRVACCITKATYAHSEYSILIAFHGNNCYANATERYVNTYIACLVNVLNKSHRNTCAC
jgi:hypothetical protein